MKTSILTKNSLNSLFIAAELFYASEARVNGFGDGPLSRKIKGTSNSTELVDNRIGSFNDGATSSQAHIATTTKNETPSSTAVKTEATKSIPEATGAATGQTEEDLMKKVQDAMKYLEDWTIKSRNGKYYELCTAPPVLDHKAWLKVPNSMLEDKRDYPLSHFLSDKSM
ncbi:hypothetical protein EJ08DRAFT_693613 [Tothia fuscella]|uniref:Uncharacterized protein n=1 Tax=Tothia fuscella TaxID=1048955 RepID=A0A9P4U2I5_9PEZI|nr:hypothetical protein EJ08DRAFT_693613 [Tothia fuscella]